MAAALALTTLVPVTTAPVGAAYSRATSGGDRTLWLHHTHTGETAKFTYKRNGKFDQAVLKQLNVFLADWRTKEPTKMDPGLFDLMWEVYQDVGGKQPYNIVSSYRSPKTNKMLASKSSAVADNSLHMRGQAMDVFIPGVNLSKLRESAMRHQVGGVGYYPTSGSPFVHMDTGSVRAWPRMTRAQLKKVFPDGKTLHVPTDGTPLSSSGRAYAQAEWSKCHAVPCNGAPSVVAAPDTMLAAADPVAPAPSQTLVAPIPVSRPANLGGGATIAVAAVEEPAQRVVPTFSIAAAGIPVPVTKSERIQLATRSGPSQTAVAALEAIEGQPGAGVIAAYVPTSTSAGAQEALEMIIERETALAPILPSPDQLAVAGNVRTASLGGATDFSASVGLKGMFDNTFNALANVSGPAQMQVALDEMALSRLSNDSISRRATDLVAPELDHVNDTLVHPAMMHTAFWSEMTEAEGYLDHGTELGALSGQVGFVPDNAAIPAYDHFDAAGPALVAQRS